MKKLILFTTAALCIGAIAMYGCKKKSLDDTSLGSDASIQDETQTALDNNILEDGAKDAVGVCGGAYNKNRGSTIRMSADSNSYLGACIQISGPTPGAAGDSTLTCTFPDEECKDNKGHANRKGTLEVSWSGGPYSAPGIIKKIKFKPYHFKHRKIVGEITFSNDASGNLTISSTGCTMVNEKDGHGKGDSTSITSMDFHRDMFNAHDPLNAFDDEYKFYGSMVGKTYKKDTSKGAVHAFTLTINQNEAIHFDLNCQYVIVGGKAKFEIVIDNSADTKTLLVDFGLGACDHNVTIIRNGSTLENISFDF